MEHLKFYWPQVQWRGQLQSLSIKEFPFRCVSQILQEFKNSKQIIEKFESQSELHSFEKIHFEWNLRDMAEILEYHPYEYCPVVAMVVVPRFYRSVGCFNTFWKRSADLKLMRLSISYIVKLSCDIYRASATNNTSSGPIHEHSWLFVIKNFSIYFDD